MSKKLNNLFGQAPGAYGNATEKNYEGAPTFVRDEYECVVRVLTTGTLEPTFYADAQTLATEAFDLFKRMRDKDPQFLAQAIVYAREQGLMRTAPITALAVLSTGTSDAKTYFRLIFTRVIQTPGDLSDFVTLCRHSQVRGTGRAVKREIADWLANMSEYHIIKYGSDRQAMSLKDIYRIAHAHPRGGNEYEKAEYVVKGTVAANLPQVLGYELFKAAAHAPVVDESGLLRLVEEHRLPWEVVTAHLPNTTETWRTMMKQMPYMALLRNLRNLLKYEVFQSKEDLETACATLSDPVRVEHSKQFPFRFWSARKAIGDDAPFRLREALSSALEQSFVNLPPLGQRVLIANDISSSMDESQSAKSDMSMREIAALFAAALYKHAEQASLVSFDTTLHLRDDVAKDQPLETIMRKIQEGHGGGTALSAPIMYALGETFNPMGYASWYRQLSGMPVAGTTDIFDVMVFITDSESWVDHLKKHIGALDAIRAYKRDKNPNLTCFFLQLAPYKHAVVPPDEPGCYYLYGWSNEVVAFIGAICGGGLTQVEAVKQVSLLSR